MIKNQNKPHFLGYIDKTKKEMLPLRPGDVHATYADVTGLIEDFRYKPNTLHVEGIKRFVMWYKSFYKI